MQAYQLYNSNSQTTVSFLFDTKYSLLHSPLNQVYLTEALRNGTIDHWCEHTELSPVLAKLSHPTKIKIE